MCCARARARGGCNSSAEHRDNEGYVLPSGVVCFIPGPLTPSNRSEKSSLRADVLPSFVFYRPSRPSLYGSEHFSKLTEMFRRGKTENRIRKEVNQKFGNSERWKLRRFENSDVEK